MVEAVFVFVFDSPFVNGRGLFIGFCLTLYIQNKRRYGNLKLFSVRYFLGAPRAGKPQTSRLHG